MPLHLLERPHHDKTNLTELPYWGQDFIGTGPFRLREWVLGSHILLEANEQYVLGRPRVDVVEVKFILDTNTIVTNVLAGAVELTLGRGLTLEQAVLARSQWKDGKVETPLETVTGLWPQFVNPQPPILADVRFRRALLHGLDRQQMVDVFLAIPKQQRLQLFGQIIHHISGQVVNLPLFHDAVPALISDRLLNIGGSKGDALLTWNAHDWDVR